MHRVNLNTPDFYLQKAWCNLQDQTQYKKKKEEKKRHSLKKHLTFMHCGMFKVTHPSSLPGRKRHTQLGIVWKGACHLASLRLSHTHMHTYNNGRLGFVFPWQSVPAIFPRWQRNMALKCCTVCVCVCVCVCASASVQRVILSREEPRCSDTHWAASSLDPAVSALIPALTETQIQKCWGAARDIEKNCKFCVMFLKNTVFSN